MILVTIFQSVEFYVICIVIAAAVLGLCVRPSSKGAARQHLLSSQLSDSGLPPQIPSIELSVNPDNSVTLVRHGIDGVCSDGAVSLAVNVAGFDIDIQERVVPGRMTALPVDTATFRMDFLAPELYHLKYHSDIDGGLVTATSLKVRPGIHIVKPLQR